MMFNYLWALFFYFITSSYSWYSLHLLIEMFSLIVYEFKHWTLLNCPAFQQINFLSYRSLKPTAMSYILCICDKADMWMSKMCRLGDWQMSPLGAEWLEKTGREFCSHQKVLNLYIICSAYNVDMLKSWIK